MRITRNENEVHRSPSTRSMQQGRDCPKTSQSKSWWSHISPVSVAKAALVFAGAVASPAAAALASPKVRQGFRANHAIPALPEGLDIAGPRRHLLLNREEGVFLSPGRECLVLGFPDLGLAATLQVPGQYGNSADAYFQVLDIQQDGQVALDSYNDPSDPPTYCLDVLNGNFAQNATVGAWECTQNNNQAWHFESGADDSYSISPKNAPASTNLCLDTYKGYTNQSTPLLLSHCDSDSETQKWKIKTEQDVFGDGSDASPCS